MKPVYSADEWNKVRKLALEWHNQCVWVVPTRVYQVVGIGGIIAGLINYQNMAWWLLITLVCWGKLQSRDEQIEGYVYGWQEGQDFVLGDYSIDKLLESQAERKNPTKKKTE